MSAPFFPEVAPLLRILNKAGVPHALIGGWAVNAWGFLRASEDIDFLVGIGPGKPKKLLSDLSRAFEAEWIAGGIDDPIPGLIRAVPIRGGLPIDLLPARGTPDRDALSRAKSLQAEGLTLPVVSPEDLIAMKLEAGGGQDFEDARRLLDILSKKIDEDLLLRACGERRVEHKLRMIAGR